MLGSYFTLGRPRPSAASPAIPPEFLQKDPSGDEVYASFPESLWFRLDVSQYYVIRTIIILDASVGAWGLEVLKDDEESPEVPPCKLIRVASTRNGCVDAHVDGRTNALAVESRA